MSPSLSISLPIWWSGEFTRVRQTPDSLRFGFFTRYFVVLIVLWRLKTLLLSQFEVQKLIAGPENSHIFARN